MPARNVRPFALCVAAILLSASAARPVEPDIFSVVDHDGARACAIGKSSRLSAHPPRAASAASDNFDATYYHLDIAVDLVAGRVSGVVRAEGRARGAALSNLVLDLSDSMTVSAVSLPDGTPLSFTHQDHAVDVALPVSVPDGGAVAVDIAYGGTPTTGGFGTFVFGSRTGSGLFAWSLSEPYGAREWWPCKDHPSDKADSVRVTVTVPSEYRVGSQGLLVGQTSAGGNTTYDWRSRYPIASYLVSVAIARYAAYQTTYQRPAALAALYGPMSMPLEHLAYDDGSADLPQGWVDAADALAVFEEWFGPYPFAEEKYGHAEFTFGGGMEHQTMSSMRGSATSLVTHELAHQWFGDGISPRTWPHIWLNEGFATYAEYVYWEARADSFPGVLESVYGPRYRASRNATGTLVLADTSGVGTMFNYTRVYAKGSVVLAMLRHVVGDAAFKEILRTYAGDPVLRYGTATTADFQRVCESVSGISLDAFFAQWVVEGTGYPSYRMSGVWQPAAGGYKVYVAIEQTHNFSQSNVGAFVMPLDIAVYTTAGEERHRVQNDRRAQSFELDVSTQPTGIALDPDMRVLRAEEVPTTFGGGDAPSTLAIARLAPNPVNAETTVQYTLDRPGAVSFSIYNVAGQLVSSWRVNAGNAGIHFETLSARALPIGVYFLRLTTPFANTTRKFVVQR